MTGFAIGDLSISIENWLHRPKGSQTNSPAVVDSGPESGE
jgi:hypothetical protein